MTETELLKRIKVNSAIFGGTPSMGTNVSLPRVRHEVFARRRCFVPRAAHARDRPVKPGPNPLQSRRGQGALL